MKPQYARMLLFVGYGAIVGVVMLGILFIPVIGMIGGELPFTLVFPWAEIVFRLNLFNAGNLAIKGICLIQMPVYGLVIGSFSDLRQRRICIVAIIVLHVVAVFTCFMKFNYFGQL